MHYRKNRKELAKSRILIKKNDFELLSFQSQAAPAWRAWSVIYFYLGNRPLKISIMMHFDTNLILLAF